MARFPKIQSPCPYRGDLAAVMDGDFCRMCKRQVIDIGGWSDAERVAFLAGCSEEVCVSYRLALRPAIAAAALAASAAVLPAAAAAQEVAAPGQGAVSEPPARQYYIIVGGIRDPRNVDYVDHGADTNTPELPVVYEDGPQPPAPAQDSGRPAGAI